MIGVYKITNPVGLSYVGQSKNIKKRFTAYRNNKNALKHGYIYQSLFEYGFENHIFEVIEECLTEELNDKERYWQEVNFVLECGLNSILIGTKDKKAVYSEDVKKKMSLLSIGKYSGEKNPMYGVKRPEVGQRNSEIKGKKVMNLITKEVYPSVADAARKNNIPISTLKGFFLGRIVSQYPFIKL